MHILCIGRHLHNICTLSQVVLLSSGCTLRHKKPTRVTRLPTASLSPASCPCRGVDNAKPPASSTDSAVLTPSWEAWTGDNIHTSSSNRGSWADKDRLVGSRLLLLNRYYMLTDYLMLHHLVWISYLHGSPQLWEKIQISHSSEYYRLVFRNGMIINIKKAYSFKLLVHTQSDNYIMQLILFWPR